MKFVETSVFTRRITEALSDEEYRHLQEALLRVVYYWDAKRELFLMLFVYSKNEQKDLTAEQRRLLGKVVEREIK